MYECRTAARRWVEFTIEDMDRPAVRSFVEVVEYNPEWPDHFDELRDRIWPAVRDVAAAIEHVGSTAVAGMAAKPVIDLDIVIPSRAELAVVITRLAGLGYEHRGNLEIEDREAFQTLRNQPPHNLYVCPRESIALRNHLALRDHLRGHPEDVLAYSNLKKELAVLFSHDIDRYVEGKTEFILAILAQQGFSTDRLEAIRRANRA
ncbi:MAG: GrpB family protein [Acidobacteriota bacterium]